MKWAVKLLYRLILTETGRQVERRSQRGVLQPTWSATKATKAAVNQLLLRLRTLTHYFNDGQRFLKWFGTITSLSELRHFTADEWGMLLQWMPAMLQNGEGILSPMRTKVTNHPNVVFHVFLLDSRI